MKKKVKETLEERLNHAKRNLFRFCRKIEDWTHGEAMMMLSLNFASDKDVTSEHIFSQKQTARIASYHMQGLELELESVIEECRDNGWEERVDGELYSFDDELYICKVRQSLEEIVESN